MRNTARPPVFPWRGFTGLRGQSAFTIIELLLVTVVIAIIAAIGIPNVLAARVRANETSAGALLRSLNTAQRQFQISAKADEDQDGSGEFGYFAELAGVTGPRGGQPRAPFELSRALGIVSSDGEMQRSGYVFRIYLPEAGGIGRREDAGGGVGPGVLDVNSAEQFWCCYAWPFRQGTTGTTTYFVSHHGEVIRANAFQYDGRNDPDLNAGSAFVTSDITRITGKLAIGTIGADGNRWIQLQ